MADEKALTQTNFNDLQVVSDVISLWADNTTDQDSSRRSDLQRDKYQALMNHDQDRGALGFFEYTDKGPGQCTALDVKTWQAYLEGEGLSASTVYSKVSKVSSFYSWAVENGHTDHNPVASARPKAPRPYQNEAAQAFTDQEVISLLDVVRNRGDVVGLRDYAILLFLLFTGRRRNEILSLHWGDLKFNGTVTIRSRIKGGDFLEFEVQHAGAKAALLDYLEASDRLTDMTPDTPLWTAHDRSGKHTGKSLSSHSFSKNFKRYGQDAGLGDIHIHQTRHTYARWVGEESGSLLEAQDALGHKNLATTRVYLQRVSIKRDKFSDKIGKRLGI